MVNPARIPASRLGRIPLVWVVRVSAGFGFGIHLGAFHFNYGINQVGGLFNKAKGLNLGFETRLVFY